MAKKIRATMEAKAEGGAIVDAKSSAGRKAGRLSTSRLALHLNRGDSDFNDAPLWVAHDAPNFGIGYAVRERVSRERHRRRRERSIY